MWVDARTEVAGHHLRTKADSEIGLLVAQRHTDPVNFAMHKLLGVIGTLRPTEDHCTCVVIHRLRQRIAKARAPDVERIAKLRQSLTDSAGRRVFLMQNEKDGLLQHGDPARLERRPFTSCYPGICKYDRAKGGYVPCADLRRRWRESTTVSSS